MSQPITTRIRVAYGKARQHVAARIAEAVMIARVEAHYGTPAGSNPLRYVLAAAAKAGAI